MARYFFDVREGSQLTFDKEGIEVPDCAFAEREAALGLTDIAREHFSDGNLQDLAIAVSDHERRALATFTLTVQLNRQM